jgi:hypothetical protein
MSRPTPTPPPLPQVRLMFEPSHLAAGCLTTIYARLVPRTRGVRPTPPQPPSTSNAPAATAANAGGTQS